MACPVRPAPPALGGRPRRKRGGGTRSGPGAGGAAQQRSIPAGLAPLAPVWALLGVGSPQPMAPAHPGELAAQAGPAAMPMRDS